MHLRHDFMVYILYLNKVIKNDRKITRKWNFPSNYCGNIGGNIFSIVIQLLV